MLNMMVDMVRKKKKNQQIFNCSKQETKVAKMLSPHNSIINQRVSPPKAVRFVGEILEGAPG